MSVTSDILRSYRAPRAVLRNLRIGTRREARLLAYLMIACGLIFVAQWPRLAREAHLNDAVPLEGLLAGALFGWVFIAPLLFYALGGILGFVLRLVVPGTEGFDVRLAVFWALLVASPLVLLHGLAMGVIGTGAGVSLTFVIVVAVFMVVLVAGLRVALEAAAARA
jgi:hypothetical protein